MQSLLVGVAGLEPAILAATDFKSVVYTNSTTLPGSPSRTRTCDTAVNSRLLYQLSYQGRRSARNQSIRLEGVLACFSCLPLHYKEACIIIVELMLLCVFDVFVGLGFTRKHAKLHLTLLARQLLPPLDQGFL